MRGFRANKLQRNVAKALLRVFGFTIFRQGTCTYAIGTLLLRDRDSTLALQGLYFSATGDSLNFYWGFTKLLLGIHSSSPWDLLKKRGLVNESAKVRQRPAEGSRRRWRRFAQLVEPKDCLSQFPRGSGMNRRIDSLHSPFLLAE